jgi:hypothetical protein
MSVPLFGKRRTTLREDLPVAADWIAEALGSSGYRADFSLDSAREVERFMREQTDEEGRPRPDGLLGESLGQRMFGLGAYLGEVLIRNLGGEWVTDDADPEGEINVAVRLQDETLVWPVQRVMKRLTEGEGESVHAYVALIAREAGRG